MLAPDGASTGITISGISAANGTTSAGEPGPHSHHAMSNCDMPARSRQKHWRGSNPAATTSSENHPMRETARIMTLDPEARYTKHTMKKASKPATSDPVRKQAVIYARVSSKEQEKEGFSIPAQLKLLKEYAAANGLAVAQEYLDVDTAKQTGRAAFGEMVAYLKSHPSVRVMLVEKTDR